MQVKTAPVSVKAVDGETGVFEAIVSVFGNKDSYGDVVMPGAFAKTLAEWSEKGDPIPVYYSHRMDDPDYNIGYVIEAKEVEATDSSPAGLYVKSQLDIADPTQTSKAPQVHRLLKGRRVTQFSFAYDVIADKKVGDVNELHELKLYEVGPTPIGANQATELLGVKALAEAAAADVKAGRAISAKNEKTLRTAAEKAASLAEDIQSVLTVIDGQAETTDQEKASGTDAAKDEEPTVVKSEEPSRSPSAKNLAHIQLLALNGQKGDS